jgi:NADPH-dependent 2,4-dienoyl-CoA reductase/sulfur reductase-like enzyme
MGAVFIPTQSALLRRNPMKKMKLVLVGNGMAGVRTIEELLKLAPDLYDITVFGAEPHGNYNRILLSPVLAGEMTLPEIMLNDLDWYGDNGITLHAGRKVVKIDRVRRKVLAGDGTEADYDRLLLATGSTPFIPPIPGNDLPGVLGYRDIADTEAMIEAAGKYRHAVVIGAGLLGLEAANGLMLRGMDVTVVHLGEWIMERQLDKRGGRHAAGLARGQGHEVPARAPDRGAAAGAQRARRDERSAWARCASRTAWRSPPTWSWSPPASGRTTSSPSPPGCTAAAAGCAASMSPTRCRP